MHVDIQGGTNMDFENILVTHEAGVATLIESVQDMEKYGGRLLLVGVHSSITGAFSS